MSFVFSTAALARGCSYLGWALKWYTPVGGAFRPPVMGDLTEHILKLPASVDNEFTRKDFVVLFEVRGAFSSVDCALSLGSLTLRIWMSTQGQAEWTKI